MQSAKQLQSGFRSLNVPDKYRGQELVTGRVFYTLPMGLLDQLFLGAGEKAFDSWRKELERELSSVMGDHSHTVGFWREKVVIYGHLRRRSLMEIRLDAAELEKLGWDCTLEEARADLATAELRSCRMAEFSQGYAGWLTTHQPFLEEQGSLLRQFASEVREWGIPGLAGPPRIAAIEDNILAESSLTECCSKFQQFCSRWRLVGLAAPNLPLPLQLQTPILGPVSATGDLTGIGSVLFLPDTYPVPSRDELRDILEESLRGRGTATHLSEWTNLVRGSNPAKNVIQRFGRIFELQHYCRALHERHAQALHGRLGDLEFALASFLKVSTSTIHRDLLFIRERLGEDWMCCGNNDSLVC